MDNILTPGCESDVGKLLARLAVASALAPDWSERTLCHRLFGQTDFRAQLLSGRVTLRRVASASKRIEKFIEDKGGVSDGNGG